MKLMDWIARSPLAVGLGHRGSGTGIVTVEPDGDSVALGPLTDLPGATGTAAGVMTAADKTKLDSLLNTTVSVDPASFDSRAQVTATAITDPQVLYLRTASFATQGDRGGALYIRAATEPSHAGKVQSADGQWWELVPERGRVNLRQFGLVLEDALSGWTTAWHTLDLDDATVTQTARITVDMSGPGCLISESGATILAANPGGPGLADVLTVLTNGHDLVVQGLTWDGQNEVPQLLQVANLSNAIGTVRLSGNTFRNVYRRTAVDGQGPADAVRVFGDFTTVDIVGNTVRNISRQVGAGIPFSQGSTGISVFQNTTNGLKYPRATRLIDNTFEWITTEETGSDRIDCDGFKIFTGEVGPEGDSMFFETHFEARGNLFRDCAGRAIKGQISHGIITGNTIIHEAVPPKDGGFADLNMQMGGGVISKNEFIYSPIGGLSPFREDGSAAAAGRAISLYHTPRPGRPAGAPVVSDNIIHNNVDPAVGMLYAVADFGRSATDPNFAYQVTARGNKMVGGAAGVMVVLPNTTSTDRPVFAEITGNFASRLDLALCDNISAQPTGLTILAQGNAQEGPAVPVVYSTNAGTEARVMVRGFGNTGFTDEARRIGSDPGTRSPSILRVASLFPQDNATLSGGVNLWSDLVADEATATLRPMGYFSMGLYVLSVALNRNGQGLFAIDSGGAIDMNAHAGSIFTFGGGSNPDVDGKINVWHDGTTLNIKNRLGSSRVMTLMCIG